MTDYIKTLEKKPPPPRPGEVGAMGKGPKPVDPPPVVRVSYATEVDRPIGLQLKTEAMSLRCVAFELIKEFDRRGIPLFFDPKGDFGNGAYPDADLAWAHTLMKRMIPVPPPKVTVTWGPGFMKPGGRYTTLGTYLSSFPDLQEKSVEEINKNSSFLMVPSHYSAEGFKRVGVTVPIHVIPHGVDTDRYAYAERNPKAADEPFTVLHISNGQGYKNLDGVIESFRDAFKGDENARLVLRVPNGMLTYNGKTVHLLWIKEYLDDPRIVFDTATKTEDALIEMYHSADCYLFASLGETFSITTLEAMATGLPVVLPDNTALSEQCGPHAFVIKKTDKKRDGGRKDPWSTPCRKETAKALKEIRDNQARALERGKLAREFAEQLTWAAAADKFLEVIEPYR